MLQVYCDKTLWQTQAFVWIKESEEEYKDEPSSHSSTFSRIDPNIWNINKI
jgi:hypothetical protein